MEESKTESGSGIDLRLVGLCVGLWIVAGVILFQNWPDTKRDYYWGNIMQGLEGQPPGLDSESVSALAAMGDAIIPSCSYELTHHWNPAFRVAVLKVLEESKGKGAPELLGWSATHDPDARVRGNALLALRTRVKTSPAERPPLEKLADQLALSKTDSDPDVNVRATASVIVAEAGNGSDPIKALLVFALRNPYLRKDAAAALAKINPDGPAVKLDVANKDLVDEIIAYEKWCGDHGIAAVASPLTAPVTSGH